MLTFDDEDTLTRLRAFNVVVHDASLACLLATQGDVSLDVVLNLVSDDLSRGPLNDKDALVVIMRDNVCIRETLDLQLGCHADFVVVELG